MSDNLIAALRTLIDVKDYETKLKFLKNELYNSNKKLENIIELVGDSKLPTELMRHSTGTNNVSIENNYIKQVSNI